jgi:hypothetical protein
MGGIYPIQPLLIAQKEKAAVSTEAPKRAHKTYTIPFFIACAYI